MGLNNIGSIYLLDENDNPVLFDIYNPAKYFKTSSAGGRRYKSHMRVAYNCLHGYTIITSFIGTNLNIDNQHPLPVLWETIVFTGKLENPGYENIWRWLNINDARNGHYMIVNQLKYKKYYFKIHTHAPLNMKASLFHTRFIFESSRERAEEVVKGESYAFGLKRVEYIGEDD